MDKQIRDLLATTANGGALIRWSQEHSTFTVTLDIYGGWIPEQDGAADIIPELPTPQRRAEAEGNVVNLFH